MSRGDRVVGRGGLSGLVGGRQAPTYRAIYDWVEREGIRDLVDVGANTGALGQLLTHWGYRGRYTAVENNPHALAQARRELAEAGVEAPRLINGNVRALPFADREVDAVAMKDVLEHLEDYRPALAEVMRVARRWVVIGVFLPWRADAEKRHCEPGGFYLNAYLERDVLEFARGHGFEVAERVETIEADASGDLPNEVVVFRRVD